MSRIIQPAIRSAARSVVGRYTPEQLYSSKRDAIQEEILTETRLIVKEQYVTINNILVRDVELPPTIKTAIERKLKQEQESLEYEFRLSKAEKEAEARFNFVYIYTLENYDDLIETKKGKVELLNDNLMPAVAAISFSTSRGVLMTRLQGTAMKDYILPIINPDDLLKDE